MVPGLGFLLRSLLPLSRLRQGSSSPLGAVSAAVVSAGLRQRLFGLRRRLRRTE